MIFAIDIGTNTEICLANHGSLCSLSTASGPAFEGAHIKYGMRAARGAIERFQIIDGENKVQHASKMRLLPVCAGRGSWMCSAGLYPRDGQHAGEAARPSPDAWRRQGARVRGRSGGRGGQRGPHKKMLNNGN